MRITGTLHSVGAHEISGDHNAKILSGIFITADDETLRAASNLLYATVDIYPHPVNGLVAGECTPENYAHALARLAYVEEHLARETRSSQALTMLHKNLRDIADGAMTEAKDLREEVKRLRCVLHKHGLSADTSGEEYDDGARDTAWAEYLNLRKQIRKVAAEGRTDSEEQGTLVTRAVNLARLHNFDPPTRALETAQTHIAELTQLLALAERSAAKYEQKYLDASQALGEARAVIDSLNAASVRGDSELSDNEDEGRR